MAKSEPLLLQDLKKLKKPIREYYKLKRTGLSSVEKVAMWVSDHVGTAQFFGIIITWTILWLGWNTFGPENLKFDPAPAFVLWLFISNVIQLTLLPLILISENIQNKQYELRSEADLEVNIIAEREIETILQHLEKQDEMILEILHKIEKK